MRRHGRLSWLMLAISSSVWAVQPEALELDLSPSSSLKGVLILPPVATVVTGQKGAFVGLDARKSVERFVLPAHQKLVTAFDRRLGGKVVPVDVVLGLLTKEQVSASSLSKPQVLARLAQVSHCDWVLTFTLSKTNAFVAIIADAAGKAAGEPSHALDVSNLTDEQAEAMAKTLVPRLLELEKARVRSAEREAKEAATTTAPPLPPVVEEQIVDTDFDPMNRATESGLRSIDKNRVRALVAVGPGAALRSLALSGEAANTLADLDNGVVAGLGIDAQVMPLEFLEGASGKPWSQLSVEAHYRRAFVHAEGLSGGVEGQSCTMTDDDFQLRVGGRYRLGEGYLPTIGVAGGWSQEQTRFACNFPLVSTTWSGIDAQLRVRQPVFRDLVTLELIGGPRFLLAGAQSATPGFSLSWEAWLEVKPYSMLFARAGGRFSRLQASSASLTVVDTRSFLTLELGAFF